MKGLCLAVMFAVAAPVAAQTPEPGMLPLSSAFQAAVHAVKAAAKIRKFNFEYGGFRGNVWRLFPDATPPGSDVTLWVDLGDRVELRFTKYPNQDRRRPDNDTSVDIDGIEAEVDGEPTQGVHLLFRDFGVEEHTVAFEAKKEGMILLYSRWSNRLGPWGRIIVRKKK